MIKRIIFDLDNTLIMYNDNYINSYIELLKMYGCNHSLDDANQLYDIIDEFELKETRYSKEKLVEFINKKMNKNFSISFIDDLNDLISNTWLNPIDESLKETLEYLFEKYELCVLTNWFTDVQEKRLEKLGIRRYFKVVIGGDKVALKPNPESFNYYLNNGIKPSECLMIGDNLAKDIKGALNVGMKALLYDYKNIYVSDEYQRFVDWKELKYHF